MEELRALPLERKIQISQARIIEWYKHYDGKVVVSFSGGKDSTVLLHMVRQLYPGVKAVFSNTGLEYASIQRHVKTFDNVDIIVPPMRFDQVISMYGYPLISKEVAEAIYYARRIRSQNGKVERESRTASRKQRELSGQRLYSSERVQRRKDYRKVTESGGGGNKIFRVRPKIKLPPDRKILSSRRALQGTDEPS